MKLMLMLMALCLFQPAQAAGAHDLDIDILNLSAENCKLTKSEILHGKVLEGNVPEYLPGYGMVFHFQIGLKNVKSSKASYTDAELKLTYECGTDKHITLYMKQIYKHNHIHGSMDVKVTDAKDVHETHEVSHASRESSHNHPGYVRWMLWN